MTKRGIAPFCYTIPMKKIFLGAALITSILYSNYVNATVFISPFQRDLTIGSRGQDVILLQEFLESRGFLSMPPGVSRGYFGALTRSALARFQSSMYIVPAAGYFGPKTRGMIDSLGPVGGSAVIDADTIKTQQANAAIQSYFAEQIGDYTINYRTGPRVDTASECVDLSARPDPATLGIQGGFCTTTYRGEYRQNGGNKIIFVTLMQVTSGLDTYKEVIKRMSSVQRFNSYTLFSLEQHELGWYPAKGFDTVHVQEGTVVPIENEESYTYNNPANVNNPVTQYFLNIFPPAPQDSITVLSPNGGETLVAGASYDIRWNTSGNVPIVDITINNPQHVYVASSIQNTGWYLWNIPAGFAPGNYKIQITPPTGDSTRPIDVSDNSFRIITANNQGY